MLSLGGMIATGHASEVKLRQESHGPYKLGPQPHETVYADVQTVEFFGPNIPPWRETDVSIIVRDSKGNVLYRRNYPSNLNGMRITAKQIALPRGGGEALLIMRDLWQSAPGTGVSAQLFRFNTHGQFVAITGDISPIAYGADPKFFPVKEMIIHGKLRLLVETQFWTGNFMVLYHYPINLDGVSSDLTSPLRFRAYPIEVNEDEAKSLRKYYVAQNASVSLYKVPSMHTYDPIKVPIRADSVIECIAAMEYGEQWWIYVRIDGKEGFVTGQIDFERLGLPSAG